MTNEHRRSIPVTSVAWLILAAGIAVGIGARSLWWGVSAAVVLFTGAWCELKAAQATAGIQDMMLRGALDRLEKKLDTLAGAASEPKEIGRA